MENDSPSDFVSFFSSARQVGSFFRLLTRVSLLEKSVIFFIRKAGKIGQIIDLRTNFSAEALKFDFKSWYGKPVFTFLPRRKGDAVVEKTTVNNCCLVYFDLFFFVREADSACGAGEWCALRAEIDRRRHVFEDRAGRPCFKFVIWETVEKIWHFQYWVIFNLSARQKMLVRY